MKVLIRDYSGHQVITEVTEKEQFEKIVKEGMANHPGAIVKRNGEETFVSKAGLKWDDVKDAEQVSALPMIVGG